MKKYFLLLLLPLTSSASIFGEENIALMRLVAGQITEINQLAKTIGIAEENRQLLLKLNEGIERTSYQIGAIQEIILRSKNLNPRSVKSISALNAFLTETKSIHESASKIITTKLALVDVAIAQSSVQTDTSYQMGQEMVRAGTILSSEAAHSSPGRASQITATSNSIKLVSDGVLLQTLSHLTELTSLNLSLERDRLMRDASTEKHRQAFILGKVTERGQKW